jgi:hypothetical protein
VQDREDGRLWRIDGAARGCSDRSHSMAKLIVE